MSFGFRDEPARVVQALLGLVDGAPHVFELSEETEHRVTLRRPRAQPGYALPDFTARISAAIRVTAIWSARAETLRLDGYFADLSTALPTRPGPRYAIQSPTFVMPPAGWEALFRRLSAARAPLDATFAQVRLLHVNAKSQIEIAFDPPRY